MNSELDKYWEGIKNNDEEALERLYKSTFSTLVNYAHTMTFDYYMAEEAVQDVFLRIWQNRSVLTIRESFKSYIFRSVHNHTLNLKRQQRTLKESVNRPTSEELWQFITNNYELNETVIEKLYAEETDKMVKDVLKNLPDQCRKIFFMSRFEALTNEEIAHKLNLSQNTVKTHIYRALQKISEVLGKTPENF